MAERKVLVKYYPPDFDPALLPRTVKPKNNQQQVRLMLPMSVQCRTCGEYVHKGKKFNGRKEEVVGENYLGIKIYRLYFRCTTCLSEITFKTDPKNSDYVVERGATRNFEPYRQQAKEEYIARMKQEREEMGDQMKVLENRTEASKREMEIQDAIEEVRELNARAQGLTTDDLIGIHIGSAEKLEEDQIEAMAQAAFAKKPPFSTTNGLGSDSLPIVKKLPDPVDFTTMDGTSTTPSSSSLPVIKRLPDPVDFGGDNSATTTNPLPPATDLLAGVELGPADEEEGANGQPNPTSIDSTSPQNSTTSPSSTSAASLPSAPLAGLVLVKKRKHKDGDKEKRKKEKKPKKDPTNNDETTTTAAPSGLSGLLGDYADDSD